MRRQSIVVLGAVVLVALLLVYFLWNERSNQASADAGIAGGSVQGMLVAEKYCQSCHQLPDPSLLDKKTWKSFLPEMGLYLGIHAPEVKVLEAEDKSFYPEKPMLSDQNWQLIRRYYEEQAPEQLTVALPTAKSNLTGFNLIPPPDFLFRPNVMATMVKIDASVKPARLYVFDAASSQLFLFDQDGLRDSLKIDGILVDLDCHGNTLYGCSIGEQLQMGPDALKKGKVLQILVGANGKLQPKATIAEGLARPVKVLSTETNSDGLPDFLVCEFGKLTGSLCLFESKGKGWEKRILRAVPGAVTAELRKNGSTGLMDIWVLFAQGDESILKLSNQGKGQFREEQILRFPPAYGSSSFLLQDVNADGREDIVYTCGDNGDATRIFKPYHGIYVYLQDTAKKFQQSFFYPMDGCYKVVAGDFKGTGRIDLAAIGYFTNPAKPNDWFAYFSNAGAGSFTAYAAPEGISLETALTMDKGDLNGDGQPDIVIGNAFLKNDPAQSSPLFGILEPVKRQ